MVHSHCCRIEHSGEMDFDCGCQHRRLRGLEYKGHAYLHDTDNKGLTPYTYTMMHARVRVRTSMTGSGGETKSKVGSKNSSPCTAAVQTRWVEMKAYFAFGTHD